MSKPESIPNSVSVNESEYKYTYKLDDNSTKKSNELNAKIAKELIREGSNYSGLEEIMLDDGKKVLALCIRRVKQANGGFINVYSTEDYKQYYQYTDADGIQQKITDDWNYLEANAENLQAAWSTLKEGHTWDAIKILASGAEDPRGIVGGVAPGVGIGKIKAFTSLKNLKNLNLKTLFKRKRTNLSKPISTANPSNINNTINATKKTVAELTNNGYTCTEVKGAIKATKRMYGKTTTSFVNPNNGKIVKTIRDGNSGSLVTKLQKDGSYIHEYTCYEKYFEEPISYVVKYTGYSEEGAALSSAKQTIEIIRTNLKTGKATTTILNNEQIARGLTYSQRYNDAIATSKYAKTMSFRPEATSMPAQDYNAISFLSPQGSISTWGTPQIEDISFICH